MERVLLIGGEGYIGNVITNHLIDKGYLVTSFDKLLYNNTVCVEQKKELKNYHFIKRIIFIKFIINYLHTCY